MTDSNNPTVIPCGDCPLYYPAYNFTLMDNGSACDVFEFRVIPVNRAGNGSASESITEHFHECKYDYEYVYLYSICCRTVACSYACW